MEITMKVGSEISFHDLLCIEMESYGQAVLGVYGCNRRWKVVAKKVGKTKIVLKICDSVRIALQVEVVN